jgi:hypothetical protein
MTQTIQNLRWAGLEVYMKGMRNIYQVLAGKPEGKTIWKIKLSSGR